MDAGCTHVHDNDACPSVFWSEVWGLTSKVCIFGTAGCAAPEFNPISVAFLTVGLEFGSFAAGRGFVLNVLMIRR